MHGLNMQAKNKQALLTYKRHFELLKDFFVRFWILLKPNTFHSVSQDGVPRTAYKGIVVFRYQTRRRIFLVGPDSLRQLGVETT